MGHTSTPETKPNAWRVFDSYGEHVATVYEADVLEAYLSKGYTATPVSIKRPSW